MAITATKTWVDEEILTHTDLNARFANIESNALDFASQSEVNAMTSTDAGLTPNSNLIVLGTVQTTTSGTTVDFTGIPSGVRRITIMFAGFSTSGTSNIMIQLGDSGGFETSGYLGATTTVASATPSSATITSGLPVTNAIAAASILHGSVTLSLMNSAAFTWVSSGVTALSNAATTHIAAGSKSLSAELTQVRITTVGGSDTFDAGSINISYER